MIDHREIHGTIAPQLPSGFFISGSWQPPHTDATLPVQDPATGDIWAHIPAASAHDVDRAVRAARAAFDGPWGRFSPTERKRCLLRLAELVEARLDELATIDSVDVGMVRSVARNFGAKALVRNLEYYASWCDKLYGAVVPLPGGDTALDYVRHEPYGVVAVITAWNTPLVFLGSKVGPALATGNTVVVKPSELGSLSTLRFAQLCAEAGLPPGVVNVLTGGPETGQALVGHPGVDKITFTGGCDTGRRIAAAAGSGLKKLTLELGGKSPQVVFADAPLDRAVTGVALGGLALSGQACAAGTRILIEKSVFPEFVERLVAVCRGLPIGDPLAPGTLLGPLISSRQMEKVWSYVTLAEHEGAEFLLRGERLGGALTAGFFVSPTIVTGLAPHSRVVNEEIFGPLFAVFSFDTEEEAVDLANATRYGLAAGVWTNHVSRAHRVAAKLRAGVVWVNTYGTLPYTVPFGGYKDSGWGREAGREALFEYTQLKNVYVDVASS